MLDFLYTLTAFLVAISILIAVHEFGHFWVARKLGVKVLRFSIGFGKPIWRKVYGKDQTEYVISALPLGGYVKMLGEQDDEYREEDKHRAFREQVLWRRMAIVAAGPIFNFLFAVFAYWLMFVVGVNGVKPVIGEVTPATPAAYAGLQSGQEIVAINGKPTPIWDVTLTTLLPALVDRDSVNLQIKDQYGSLAEHRLDFSGIDAELEPDNFFKLMGFIPWRPKVRAIVGKVVDGSPASFAGLQAGDRIVSIDGESIDDFLGLYNYVSPRPNTKLQMLIERDGRQLDLPVTTRQAEHQGKSVGQLGIAPKDTGRIPDEMRTEYGYPPFTAIGKAFETTWTTSIVTLKMLGKLLTGGISLSNLSGPLNIAVHAGYSASAGLPWFLKFLAVVSISLGILNLLPIPILDGGHLFYYMIEGVKGSPLSEAAQEVGLRIGVLLLVMLMGLALYFDILRLLN